MKRFEFKAIGTSWIIDIHDEISEKDGSRLLALIEDRIDNFDKVYSRFRSDSLVSRIAESNGEYAFPVDSVELFRIYRDLYDLTGGYFTPLIGDMLIDAGYDSDYSLKQKRELRQPPKWNDVMDFISKEFKLITKQPLRLDFGAAGKGYLIDLVGEVIRSQDIQNYSINAGGDILHKGQKSIRIGLENPGNFSEVVGICDLKNRSIAGSAANRRVWGKFTHIMNPQTLTSTHDIAAVWVVADTAILADALTTCLFFVKPEKLIPAYNFEYVIMYNDHSYLISPDFPGELFVQNQ